MPTIRGRDGIVKTATNTIAEMRTYSIEETGETADNTTVDNSNGWRTHKATFNSWSGTVDCLFDPADTNGQTSLTAGSNVALKFYPDGDGSGKVEYAGDATVIGINRQSDLGDMVSVSFSFLGNGPLNRATVPA